jgi:hypothetical protein
LSLDSAEKATNVNRNAIFMVGIGFFLVAFAPVIGVFLIISGLVQWVRGKEHHQK